MKKFSLYTLALLVGALTFFSCQEKDRAFPEFEDLEKGAYPRLVEGVFGDLDYEHPTNDDSSSLSFTVEFYDENQGKDVTSYNWVVTYGDTFGPATLRNFSSSDFTTNADGLPQLSVTFTFAEIFAALGMTIDDFELTKNFQLDATLGMSNGKNFTADNTGSNIIGQPTFQGLFSYTPPVTKKPCNSELEGTFDAETKCSLAIVYTSGGWAACEGNTFNGTVRFEAEHDPATFDVGSYKVYSIDADGVEFEDFSMGAFAWCYGTDGVIPEDELPLGDLRFTESCGVLGIAGSSQWGEVYIITSVSADGADATIVWESDFGEAGESTLTRLDGNAWPELQL